MYNTPVAGAAATLAFTGTVLDTGWLIVAATSMLFAGLALMKIAPKRRKADR